MALMFGGRSARHGSASVERRLYLHSGFSAKEKCEYMSRMIPNSLERVIEDNDELVFCSQYSADGTMCITACQNGHIRIYETCEPKWKRLETVVARTLGWAVLDTELSTDNRLLAYCSWSPYVHVVKILRDDTGCKTGAQMDLHFEPSERHFCLFSLKWSWDSSEIVGGSSDSCLHVFNLHRNEKVLCVRAHMDDVNSVCFLEENSNVIVSGSDDTVVKIWDRRDLMSDGRGQSIPAGVFEGHTEGITHVSSKGDGRYIISNSKDQSIKLWDLRKMSRGSVCETARTSSFDYRFQTHPPRRRHPSDVSVGTFTGHQVFQTLIRSFFSPRHTTGQRYIVSGSSCGSVHIYDTERTRQTEVLHLHRKPVRDVSMDPYRTQLVSSSWDGRVILSSHSKQPQQTINSDLVDI